MIVTGSFDGTLKTWDLEGSKLLHTFKGHMAAVSGLQARPPAPPASLVPLAPL